MRAQRCSVALLVLLVIHQQHKAESPSQTVWMYRKDVDTVSGLSDTDAKAKYREIASTAESGWDFSSRWGSRTTHVIPTELNTFLMMMEKNMQHFAQAGHLLLHVRCMHWGCSPLILSECQPDGDICAEYETLACTGSGHGST